MPISNSSPSDNKLPAARPGRMPSAHTLTPADISRKVDELLQTDRSNLRNYVLELLYQFVALTEASLYSAVGSKIELSENLASFNRCLRYYRADGLIANVSQDVLKRCLRAGLPKPESRLRAYCLGPVGKAYAERKGWNGEAPIKSVNETSLAHDLLCAEAMICMSNLWLSHPASPGQVEVRGPREVLAWNTAEKKQAAAPDGMLIKRSKDGGAIERVFLVEYQNTRALVQVQTKLKKYLEIATNPEFRWVLSDVWEVSAMPVVLVIYRQGATLTDYQEEIARREDMPVVFASTSLEEIWQGNLSIKAIKA